MKCWCGVEGDAIHRPAGDPKRTAHAPSDGHVINDEEPGTGCVQWCPACDDRVLNQLAQGGQP